MRSPLPRAPRLAPQRLSLAVAGLLVVLLALLAALQWRWIGEVSDLERQRMRASLLAAGSRFAEDFDREVTRVFLYFHPEPGAPAGEPDARVSRQYARWRAEAPYPGLVRDVYLVRRDQSAGLDLRLLHPESARFEPAAWPADLAGVRRHLEEGLHVPPRVLGIFGAIPPVAADVPALLLPLTFGRPRRPPAAHTAPAAPPGSPGSPGPDAPVLDHLIVRLDRQVIARQLLPALTRRHFAGPEGGEYALAVFGGRQPKGPERAVYLSDPRVPVAAFRDADVRLDLLGLRQFDELQALGSGRRRSGIHRLLEQVHFHLAGGRVHEMGPHGGAWQLAIKRRDGSLEEAVAAVRRRNLAVSLSILALLAATAGMMVVTTQRAQRLARQQLEFVAGVTHELHTPLTAIRSAGANLADGVVAEPAQVRRYGAMIEGEGRRLSDMVGQALELAGIQSGRRVYHPRPVDVAEVIDGALQDCRWLLEERGIAVEREVERDLPPVLADAAALRRAVQNLVENAVKHGGSGGWIGVRARRAGGPPSDAPDGVEIAVADRGPGLRREDLPHLFEPFYRGRAATAAGIAGSGLGLSLVRHVAEALGGRVTARSEPGNPGSVFTLHLPAAEPA
jgi:signal transduction histidine kinase